MKKNVLNCFLLLKDIKVLYVEDDAETRKYTLKILENYFTNIDVAVNGKDGIEKYNNYFIETNNYYDLIISDIQMPVLNGIEMNKAIYKINKKQKIIMVSAYDDNKEYLIELIRTGVEGFIQKPVLIEQLENTLLEFCDRYISEKIIRLFDGYTYNWSLKELLHNGDKISITKNESKFLECLIENRKMPKTIEDIFNYIYYDNPQKEFSSDSVKSLVKRFRKKVSNEFISYDRLVGYSIKIDE